MGFFYIIFIPLIPWGFRVWRILRETDWASWKKSSLKIRKNLGHFEQRHDFVSASSPGNIGEYMYICFVVWNMNFMTFHNIWDNPSHWLSYVSRWLKLLSKPWWARNLAASLTGMIDAFHGLIAFLDFHLLVCLFLRFCFFPCYSLVSPLKTKAKQRTTIESTQPQTKGNQRKPKETTGNQRIPKEQLDNLRRTEFS